MSDKHEVTVYDRVPATARVSFLQLESYLKRTGWTLDWIEEPHDMAHDLAHWVRSGLKLRTRRDEFIAEDIEDIADVEKRQPSSVLADIAKEQA